MNDEARELFTPTGDYWPWSDYYNLQVPPTADTVALALENLMKQCQLPRPAFIVAIRKPDFKPFPHWIDGDRRWYLSQKDGVAQVIVDSAMFEDALKACSEISL